MRPSAVNSGSETEIFFSVYKGHQAFTLATVVNLHRLTSVRWLVREWCTACDRCQLKYGT
jgi:hypothetical protein